MDKREQLTKELRRARGWILGVGIAMVIFDQIYFAMQVPTGMGDNPIVVHYRNILMIADGVVLAFFIGMFVLGKWKPVLACVLALVAFWALQLFAVREDPTQIYKGFLIKGLFTWALITGIQSARRAQTLQSELGAVFE